MRTEQEMTYEAPVILDVAELTGTFAGDCGVCITGGGAAHLLS